MALHEEGIVASTKTSYLDVKCPKCGAPKGIDCAYPSGVIVRGGHVARQVAARTQAKEARMDRAVRSTAAVEGHNEKMWSDPQEAIPDAKGDEDTGVDSASDNSPSSSDGDTSWLEQYLERHTPDSISIVTHLELRNGLARKEVFITFDNTDSGLSGYVQPARPVQDSQS